MVPLGRGCNLLAVLLVFLSFCWDAASNQLRQVFQIQEEQPPRTVVGTILTKPDFSYRFSESHALFAINATTGVISTTAVIDREALPSDVINIVVLSSQPTYPTEVRIVVLDINDNTPAFPESSIAVTFREDSSGGRQVILDTATDADTGSNGVDHRSYRIVRGNEGGQFRLDITVNPSGEGAFLHLVTAGSLDRETEPCYQLLVEVEDRGLPRRFGYLQVNVTVLDTNDNSPRFSQAHYQGSVAEDVAVGFSVLRVTASDRDQGANGDVAYSLDEGTPFAIEPLSGVVTVREALDYETKRQYSLVIRASDGGSPPLSGRAEATLQLLDVNDNDPVVRFRYLPASSRFAAVDENAPVGTVVALLTVSDADSSANGNVSVSLLGGNEQLHFAVRRSPVPGLSLVQVAAALDRERIPSYNLSVWVSDRGVPRARSSLASLLIFVNDINDHAPLFQQPLYRVWVAEDVPVGSYIGGLSATDGDSGLNARLRYAVVSGNRLGWFRVSEESGLVTSAARLDRESVAELTLNISAQDQGLQPRTSYTTLHITVGDVNDQAPAFPRPSYRLSVPEHSPAGTQLAVLTALDKDQGANGTVRFLLEAAAASPARHLLLFRLDPVSGRLSCAAPLDREEQPEYHLLVRAVDKGTPPLSSVARVTVTLLDINDNRPTFYPVQYFANVQENEPAGTYIGTVSAADPDLGSNGTVNYSITAGDTLNFQIHRDTGIISTRRPLDREEKTAYQLQVIATDGGNLRSQNPAIVTITVIDTQDNPPSFSQNSYSFVIFENIAIGSLVGTVSASSLDLNTNITYLITSGDQRGMFTIGGSTGQINTAGTIDREERAFYQLKVVASGGTVTGETLVNITVKDLNDNSPRFPHAVENINAVENWGSGHMIFQAEVKDPDEGINGLVSYSLRQNPKGLFHVDEKTGTVTLNGPLDITAGSYQVEAVASDMGVPQRASSLILTVYVHDVNDNSPVFDQLSYEVTISEAEPVNSRFFKIQASDKDSGVNGEITYDIAQGNREKKFGIFPDGQLYIKTDLDRESQSHYVLMVIAADRAVEPLSATVNVTIILEDVNDNRPLFNSTNYVFHFEEEQKAGSTVGYVNAVDNDLGFNGEVKYTLEMPQLDFELNAVTGEIISIHQFDREAVMWQRGAAVFTFTIIASDQGLPKPLQDHATVQIHIRDTNDNVPRFTKDLYQATISESAGNLTPVLRVSASDVDEGNNALVNYSIIKGNEEEQFTIQSTTGQVTLVGKLDHEATASYSLTLLAVDLGSEPLSSTCTLIISVLDENDNTPLFPKSVMYIDALENMRVGELVESAAATDSDSGDNAEIHYSITGSNNHGTFSISHNTGSIFLAKTMDFETQSVYHLNITAKDNGRPPRSSTMSVVIQVRDFNDNPPSFPPGDVFKSIMENIPVGTSVLTINAQDPDADINGELQYCIAQQIPRGNHFVIRASDGTLRTNAEIDREFSNLFELTIKAIDQAVPLDFRRFALKNVTILVTDQNDNAPVFVSQNALVADSALVMGSILTTIRAIDLDEGPNGEVEYELLNGDSNTFMMDRYNGDIRIVAPLVPSRLTYHLVVSAVDFGPERRTTSTELTIILQGLDGPVFTQPKYITILREGEPVGTSVISLEAADPRDSSALLEYYIVSVRCGGKSVGRLFTIGHHNGVIQTAAVLDREQGPNLYLVDVYAVEKSSSFPRTQKAEVEITLQDINDNPPVFPADALDVIIEENIGDGFRIIQLSATDADEGPNALVTYTIISGADNSFRIDPESGDLLATKRLDRERRSKYSLLVRADDGLQSSDMRINITVSDINDHTPKFSRDVYSFDIPEDAAPGSIVAATLASDADSGTNGEITYVVEEDDEDGVFFLNSVTGVFNLTQALDYEKQPYYILTVRAGDGGGQFSTVRVYFNVLDVNDNPPIFNPSTYSTVVMENLPLGVSILTIKATDADDGPNSQLAYNIASGDSLQHFDIDNNGVLSIKQQLDRESQSFYNLLIRAHDLSLLPASRLTSTAQVSVILLDVNDSPPRFISSKTAYMQENSPMNTVVYKAQATDPDSGPNSYVEYTLLSHSGNKFSIGTIDGELRLTGELDREDISNYTLTVVATDKGKPPLSSTMDVTVIVLDVNDNIPVFQKILYEVEISENTLSGVDLIQVTATDLDEGANSQIRYHITHGNLNNDFRIDSVTGVVSVAKQLDCEAKPSYSLIVQATDRGSSPQSATAVVNIDLSDVNDFLPIFELSPYTVHVQENAQNLPKSILQVVARDDDHGLNGQLTYTIVDGNAEEAFTLTPNGLLSLIMNLDRETSAQFALTVIATDAGSPVLTGTGTITLIVDDVNDNIPTFAFKTYHATIPEDVSTGTDVLLVNATDVDEGSNAVISYSLVGGNSQFSINPSTGQIITSALLNRENKEMYSFVVVATDGGIPQAMSSSATVFLTVSDINDNPPRFRHFPYVTHIPAPTNAGSFVFAVTVSDDDEGPNAKLQYSLTGINVEKFQIDPSRGAIMAAQRLTEDTDITVTVNVKDSGIYPMSDSTTVTVRFGNETDFPQINVGQQSFIFPEDQKINTYIATVSASSTRRRVRGSLSYYVASGNLGDVFHIDQLTGKLVLTKPLDFEAVQNYVLWIEARDMGYPPYSSYKQLDIAVLDVNDNAPVFKQDPFMANIMENTFSHKITTVVAEDKDSGPNGQIDYTIVDGNKGNNFNINRETGEIRNIGPLDRERNAQYTLTVKATDKGASSRSSLCHVIIDVLDENDNAPRFSQIFSAQVSENAAIGYTVTRVTTSDEDTGVNAVSRYSIRDVNLPFSINAKTGDITVSRPLNREDVERYTVKVYAHDSGWTVNTDVTVFVTDVNDNAPRFTHPSYYLDYPELTAIGSRVTKVVAIDTDSGLNGQVFYFIKSQTEFFRINSTTGEIWTKQYIKYHNSTGSTNLNINRHSFIVTASDRGRIPMMSEATVIINIVDSNDNAPQFESEKYFTPVTKNVQVGTRLIKVTAVDDKDYNLNSEIEYHITGGNSSDQFTLNKNDGWVSVASSLRASTNKVFLIRIAAMDKGNPPLSATSTVRILVTEENMHTPQFSDSHISITVPESLATGTVIRTVSARDKDANMNGLIRYNISKGNEARVFSIINSTGAISLAGHLDFESQQRYELAISAEDGGWVKRTGYLSITVHVTDSNDNAPLFSPDEYFPVISENAPSGTIVVQLNATDADSGGNAVIAYTIKTTDSDLFVIDPNTGVITTQGFLDFEMKQSYHLYVKAFNVPDEEEHFSFANVFVQLSGVNEYVPRFLSRQYAFEISEAASKGTAVGEVFASDRDLGNDGVVSYLLVGKSKRKGFRIDKKTGQLYVSGQLDREKEENLYLKVLAKNAGSIRGFDVDEVFVNITVLDANDPPVFTSEEYSVHINEGAAPGAHVIFVSAFDSDSVPSWSRFTYHIGAGNEEGAFSIDSQSGQVSVAAELDRESIPVYNLSILAVDSGAPSATGSTCLIVNLDDINDNGPTLTSMSGEVVENQRAGSIVMTLNATDPDLPPNQGPFNYHLLSTGPATSYFSLSSGGILSTTREIDREQISDFYLSVITRDSGMPQMSSTGIVHVTIHDQNDNPSEPRTVEIFVHYFGNLFPGGTLASVKPQDPDILDTFRCNLTTEHTTHFNIPADTCNLNSQPRSTDGKFDLIVHSSDGLHSTVNSNVHVFFIGFNNVTIDNSVLLRLNIATVKDFLTNYYLHFLRIVKSHLSGMATAVQIYGFYELNEKTYIMAAVMAKRTGNQYLSPNGVATFFESIKETLFRQSGVRIDSVDHDPCTNNPCRNGGSCVKRLAVGSSLQRQESVPVVIVANTVLEPFICQCLPGYSGHVCETDIDECLPFPCHNGGTCHNLISRFSCTCPEGFMGTACERDINECQSNPCKSGGTCQNFPGGFRCACKAGYTGKTCDTTINYCECNPCFNEGTCQNQATGYYCHCPFGVFGKYCEVNSYGFEELSYMEFPSLDPNNNYIYIKFSTIKENSLLMYNYDNQTGNKAEFLALEIVDGMMKFSFNLGSGAHRLMTTKRVSDGQFHTVVARRAGLAASLTVDTCSEDRETGYCTTTSLTSATDWTLEVQPNRLTVGGIRSIEPILQRKGQVVTHDFVGCVMEFAVNGRPLEPSQALANHGILDRCVRIEGVCLNSPCQHDSACVDYWSWQQCDCKHGYTGKYCEKLVSVDTALSLDGKGHLEYMINQNRKRDYLVKQSLKGQPPDPVSANSLDIKFRTRSKNGILIHVQENSNYTTVKVKNGKIHYTSDAGVGGKVERNIPEISISDGQWHTIVIEKNGSITTFAVDRIYTREILHNTQDFGGLNVLTVSLGGIPPRLNHQSTDPDFDGCISYFTYNGETLPFTGQHRDVTILKSHPSVKIGCRGPNVCSSDTCSGGLMCVNQWYAYDCVPPGECASVPCQNGGSCEPLPKSGFTCTCPELYTGKTCETVVVCVGVQCPQGTICKAGVNKGYTCSPKPQAEELSLPLWAVPAIVGSCATFLALIVLGLILCNQCRGRKAKVQNDGKTKKKKEKKKKGSENEGFDDPDHLPPYDDELTVRKQPEGVPKPDIIERENPYLIFDETDIPHTTDTLPSGQPCIGPETELEHYDIENASSIAPSDADIIQHYKHFRSHTPKFSIQRHSPLGFARQSPLPLGASSLSYQPSYSQGLRTTPLSHSSCQNPNPLSRHSPAPFSKPGTFYRNSPARDLHLSRREGSPIDMHSDICQPGIFNYASRLGRRSKSPQTMTGHSHGSRPGSRLKQPIEQIPLETTPPVGLSIEEVERLNTPRPRNPSICSADHGRSSSDDDCRRPLSRMRNPADGTPAPESSSDSDSHESFTCSEFEYDRDKPAVYTSRMPKLSQVNESDADDEDNYAGKLKPRRYHGRRAEGSSAALQASHEDYKTQPKLGPHGAVTGAFNWDSLLNWGPGFGNYVDVFKDLASLPENATTEAKEEALKNVVQSAATSNDAEAEEYV
ncbi:protocadherin Fat 4 isoform X1 [Scyliorhinus canicula]|uniref:protocadherin Fat 4 isoform X1 n=2 Tax=Scyliorhinus canicula TaxID=7830 RepID=UPI0018F765EB|nr:protocadherin Fat 4 isoform X1 [Scyliorhinus canicula]